MRILITNSTLALRGGTEAFVQDLAVALKRLGHDVVAYSNIVGEAAVDLQDAGIPVIDDLSRAPWIPDILHCHHNMEAMTALLHFSGVPAIFVSHGWVRWLDAPVRHPRVLRYVAVDGPTQAALLGKHRLPAARVQMIPNFIDLDRFAARAALPAKPRRALVFSHYASESSYVPIVRDACRRRNVQLDVMGYGVGRPVRFPERILGNYDLVFAKGRAALEALVTGTAVVVCDSFGMGPMVSTANVKTLRTLEGDYLQWFSALTVENLLREIDRYDPVDVAELTRWAREHAGATAAAAAFVTVYDDVCLEWPLTTVDPAADARASAAYLRWLSLHVKEQLVERDQWVGLAVGLRNRIARMRFLAPLLLRLSAKIQTRLARGKRPADGSREDVFTPSPEGRPKI